MLSFVRIVSLLSLLLAPSMVRAEGEAADAPRRPVRIAVYQLSSTGIEPRVAQLFVDSFLAELRKLQRASVISMDEAKALLDLEAQKQLLGCSDSSCLAEIAEALGADILVVGGISGGEGKTAVSLKRIDARNAVVVGDFTQQLLSAGGDELLAAVGPIVEKLFADMPLRPSEVRGVAPELALRLNPPPVAPAVFYVSAGATAVGAATSAIAGFLWFNADQNLQTSVALAKKSVQPGRVLLQQQADVQTTNAVFWGAFGSTAAVAVLTGVLVPFTDFRGIGDES